MKLNFMKLHPAAITPVYATEGAMAFDLASMNAYDIEPGLTVLVDTGIAVEPPPGYAVIINCRSSAAKFGLTLANNQGWIDPDYRGPILVALHNTSKRTYCVLPQGRVAQAMLVPVHRVEFEEVRELSVSARGDGCFGSTGA